MKTLELDMCAETQHTICATLTWCVRGPQGAGSGVLVGFGVAGGERFGHRCGGMIGGVAGPAQCELQSRTLRETLKRRQTLQKQSKRGVSLHRSAVWTEGYLVHAHKHTPFHLGWSPRSPSSYRRDTPPSLAWTPHTRRPITADACTQVHDNVFSLLLHKRCNGTFSFLCQKMLLCVRARVGVCVCLSPVFIKDCHLSYKCGFSLLPESGAPPFPVHGFFWKVWKRHTVAWTSAPPNCPSFSAGMWSYEGDFVFNF